MAVVSTRRGPSTADPEPFANGLVLREREERVQPFGESYTKAVPTMMSPHRRHSLFRHVIDTHDVLARRVSCCSYPSSKLGPLICQPVISPRAKHLPVDIRDAPFSS